VDAFASAALVEEGVPKALSAGGDETPRGGFYRSLSHWRRILGTCVRQAIIGGAARRRRPRVLQTRVSSWLKSV